MASYGTDHTAADAVVGVTVGPDFATMVNEVLAEFRATLEAKVTPSGMDMNTNLSFLSGATRSAVTNLHRAHFYAQPSLLSAVTYPAALFVSSTGELMYNDTSGNQATLTSAGTVGGTAGSITGAGYGSGGVVVNWDSGTSSYQLKAGSGSDDYAHVAVNDLRLNDASSHFLRMATQSMAADYTILWPAAVAATNSILAASTSGSDTTIAFTPTPTVTSLTTTATAAVGTSATVGTTLTVGTGITLTAGIIRHPNFTRYVSAFAGTGDPTGAWVIDSSGGSVSMNAANIWLMPIDLQSGASLSSVSFFVDPNGSNTKTFRVMSVDGFSGIVTTHETVTSTSTATNEYTVTVSPEVNPGSGLRILYAAYTAGDTGDELFGISYTFNHP